MPRSLHLNRERFLAPPRTGELELGPAVQLVEYSESCAALAHILATCASTYAASERQNGLIRDFDPELGVYA